MKKTPSMPAAARALVKKLGAPATTVCLQFTVTFHAPKQGRFAPPPYRVVVDTKKDAWLTVQHYNDEPRALTLAEVRVPTEMTRFTMTVRAGSRSAVKGWAAQLLGG